VQLYANPLDTSADFADPFVMRFNGRYYLYCTDPLVECWTSDDLTEWERAGPTIGPDVFPGLVPFAPEVHYAQGFFYMVTSPHGRGHHILRGDSPLGPFELVTPNLGRAIDGHVLVDDDGRWYFYWSGWEGIWACEMPSPTELGEPVLTGAAMNGWTEGPFVTKRDGHYFMTLTGNHFLSPGYRINVAVSDNPLTGYVDDPLNPVLVCAEGEVVGLGHSSSVLGPDLVSTHIVYHNLLPDGSRQLDLDRQVWCGRSLAVLGPSRRAVAPAAPDVSCDWRDESLDGWRADGALVTDGEGWAELSGGRVVWEQHPFTALFTAELTLAGGGEGTTTVRLAAEGESGIAWVLDAAARTVALGGVSAPLPTSFVPGAAHVLRLECDGTSLTATLDGGSRCVVDARDLEDARVAVEPGPLGVRLGYVGLTRTTPETADRGAVRPVPGRFWAALASSDTALFVDPSSTRPQRRLVLEEGAVVEYRVLAAEAGRYRIIAVGDLAEDGELELACSAGPVAALPTGAELASFVVDLGTDVETISLGSVSGRHVIDLVHVLPEVAPRAVSLSNILVRGHDKRLVSDERFVDLHLDAELSVDRATADGHGDLVFRASHLSLGYEGDDARLGSDFLLGYSVQVHGDRVALARHDYDTTVLAQWVGALNLFAPLRVQVSLRGARIQVWIDGDPVIDHVDPLPHLVGGVGLRAVDSTVRAASLAIRPSASS